jgi:hypothetical protein
MNFNLPNDMNTESNECFGLKITPLNSFETPWCEWLEDNGWSLSDHLINGGSVAVSTGVESNNLEAIRIHYKDSANKDIVENYLRSLGSDLYNKLVVIDSEVRKQILLVYRCNEVIIPRSDDLFLWGNMDGMKLYAYHIGEGNSFIFNTYQFEVKAGVFDPISKIFEISNISEKERKILWTNTGKLDQYQII